MWIFWFLYFLFKYFVPVSFMTCRPKSFWSGVGFAEPFFKFHFCDRLMSYVCVLYLFSSFISCCILFAVSANLLLDDVEAEDDDLIINTLQNIIPLASNKDRIFQLMTSSFQARRSWIASASPTLGAILERYPRFLDTSGLVRLLSFK
jgi:hypothetical protein